MKQIPLQNRVMPHEIGALAALLNNDHFRAAEIEARHLLALHPNAGMLWKILGAALTGQGKDALPALQKTAELIPQDAEAHRQFGTALYGRGQWQAALASLARALALAPRDVDALVSAADALRALHRAREAIPLYQNALRINPRCLEAQNNLGNAHLELGQHDAAVACYFAALQISPDEAPILCNLGNALRQLGRLPEALGCSQRAIALDPRSSFAHNNLGMILAALGQRTAAVSSYRQALALNPGYAEALNNLGNVLRDLGDQREALRLYARAVESDPQRAESHCNLGSTLLDLRRLEEATASYRRALQCQPDYALAYLGLATAQRQQRRAVDAEASCRAALAIDPNFAEVLSLLGELRADRGHFDEAQAMLQRAIDINPKFVPALTGIAAHKKMAPGDAGWQQKVEALLLDKPPLGHEISLRYALGKFFDDVQRYDDAFSHYRQANELTKRYGVSYDRSRLTGRVDEITRRFDAAFMQRPHDGASSSQVPVFIVGMPRSGTSLTEQILASHPAVFGAGEVTFWDAAYSAGASPGPQLAQAYLDGLTAASPATARVIDKLPANFLYLGMIHAAFPQARIIHMQRHPIDTCLSIYFQNFFAMGPYANDLENLAHYYREYIRITSHWRAVLPRNALLEVPYEALVANQEGWTRRMLDFLDLPWEPACLDFQATNRDVITASRWQVRQKINPHAIGRWRRYRQYLGPLEGLEAHHQ